MIINELPPPTFQKFRIGRIVVSSIENHILRRYGLYVGVAFCAFDTIHSSANIYAGECLSCHYTGNATIASVIIDDKPATLSYTHKRQQKDLICGKTTETVDGVHYAVKVIGSDLVFSPTSMVAGDYTATLTVSETGLDCESTVASSFTIALSGHLYSKWTDVLFVSNADGRFVSYQWFADGVAMPGETMQRLYDPKGLAGTTTLYQCRMNTTDGKTIYTCPQTFDDATPSRTQNTGSSAPIKKIYDTMGRPVNGTPTRGIYIVVMEIDGEQVTTKMLIHD